MEWILRVNATPLLRVTSWVRTAPSAAWRYGFQIAGKPFGHGRRGRAVIVVAHQAVLVVLSVRRARPIGGNGESGSRVRNHPRG
jgi:hypothetical protein